MDLLLGMFDMRKIGKEGHVMTCNDKCIHYDVCGMRKEDFANIEECFAYSEKRPEGVWNQISPAKIYECCNCGQNVMTDDIEEYRFCHGCGAKMGGR